MIDMSKEKKVDVMFKRTEIDESLKCMGNLAQLTLCPLKAVIYVRGKYGDIVRSNRGLYGTNMGERITKLEDFIYGKTNWQLCFTFSDIDGITFYNHTPEYYNSPLEGQISLSALLRDIDNGLTFDVLVVDSITQISRDLEIFEEVCTKLIANQIVIFCLDTSQTVVFNDLVQQKISQNSISTNKRGRRHA